ncbi:MAG: hypothetical protein ABIR26_17960 [Ramlibacter sp.]
MIDLKNLFHRPAKSNVIETNDPGSDYHPSSERGGLEVEYQKLVAAQFRHWGVAMGCVTIEVRKIGVAADGYDVFVAMVRLMQWHRPSAIRVLLGLPVLEAKIRKAVRSTWLADHAHFVGLWLHSSEQLQETAGMTELRELVKDLAPPSSAETAPSQVPAPADASPHPWTNNVVSFR